jgi:dehydrogenase/reductase SDR family member 7B
MQSFNNKVVIITGGSLGIGFALASQFGKLGAKVVITGRNKQHLDHATELLTKEGTQVLPLIADVSVEQDNINTVNQTIAHFGQIDILINNAGITMRSMFEDLEDLNVIRKVMDINFFGTVYATKYALPYIRKTKGSIVGVSSIAGYRGLPVRTGYSASKFAVNGFIEALRTELLHEPIHILLACPGYTSSNIRFSALDGAGNETGESVRNEDSMMSADQVANEIIKAIKKRKKELILTSSGRWTVFLNKWMPGKLFDRIVYKSLSKEKDSPLH